MKADTLYPYPQGWYCISPSRDLKNGAVKALTFCGSEFVLFRTKGGEAVALDAFCPHLGAHLGHGGVVVGETIECPFHAFRFDQDGTCVKTGYGTPPPSTCTVSRLPVVERDGLILAWHDPLGQTPMWQIPKLESAGWREPVFSTLDVRSHPQETSENSVDLGHLTIVHGYGQVTETQPVEIVGQRLTTRYSMSRVNPFKVGPANVHVNFEASVYGLGVSVVQIHVEPFGFELRLFILSTPTNDGRVTLRAGVSIKNWKYFQWLPKAGMLDPARWLEKGIQLASLQGITHDVSQDLDIWENKIYVSEPRLAKGDGPIGRYRLWCRQFYPEAIKRRRDAQREQAAE